MLLQQVSKGRLCDGCDRYNAKRCNATQRNPSKDLDILFVAEQPDAISAANNLPFSGHGGKIVKTAVQQLTKDPKYRDLHIAYTHAVQCESEDETPPSKKVMQQCLTHLRQTLLVSEPKLVIVLGANALKQMGVKQKHKDVRGKMTRTSLCKAPIFVTYSDKALLAQPGLFMSFRLDLKNAFNIALHENKEPVPLEELSKDYLVPKDPQGAIDACQHILEYTAGNVAPENWTIAVDTETTTLHTEKKTAKIIAFCFAWDRCKAATILYDHPHASEAYRERLPEIREAINKVLQSSKPKIFHNGKFDLKFIELNYGSVVNNVRWDTLLGEHLLDEDKKGSYGLKALTAGFLPEYCGYEDKLYDLLLQKEGMDKVEELDREITNLEIVADEHPEYIEAMNVYRQEFEQWLLDDAQYQEQLASYTRETEEYEFRKSHLAGRVAAWKIEIADWPKGKKGKPKKPVRRFTRPVKPKAPKKPHKPKDPRSKKEKQISEDAGFENVPIHDLQIYGAIDADVTRQLALIQRKRIQKERSRVAPLMQTHAIPASRVLGSMEHEGTRVDLPYIDVLDESLTKVIEKTEKELYQMAGTMQPDGSPLNLNHAGTLANVLFNWGWTHPNGTFMEPYDAVEKTKKGQYSTSEKTLSAFIDYVDEDKTIPTDSAYFLERMMRYRKASKARNTFLANVRALSKRDGFLHTQFHLNGTGTGRLSCISGSTRILTNHGLVCVSNLLHLQAPFEALTHELRWRPIRKVFIKGVEAMFDVTTDDSRTIRCTSKHRFLTPSGWRSLKTLSVGATLHCADPGGGLHELSTCRITEINPVGTELVYDLTVEEDASYIAEGFVNHNSSDMNMQNVPKYLAGKNIKKLFIPDDDSYVMANVDYKGAEVRVFTAYAPDPALIKALNEGLDMHSFFASKVFKLPYEHFAERDNPEVIPDAETRKLLDRQRSQIKRVVFGILYGAGPHKIAETIGVSPTEAQELIELLYLKFPEIRRYAEQVGYEVAKYGFVETHFGRRRRFPLAMLSRHRGRAQRQARNFKIQSTSSDIVIAQMIEFDKPLRHDFGGRSLLTVHDSVVFQFPKKYLSQLEEAVLYYMKNRVREKYKWLPVPFAVDIEVGPNYGECIPIKKYFAKHGYKPKAEGIIEENELLNELRSDAFNAA